MKNRTACYAVMGAPIAHSLSPRIHQAFAQQTGRTLLYKKIAIDLPYFESQVRGFFEHGGRGLNITAPCKQRAFMLSDKPSTRSQLVKAANMLWMEEGACCADNTDGIGFAHDLSRYLSIVSLRVLILGAGDVARSILDYLYTTFPLQVMVANRSLEKAWLLKNEYPLIEFCSLLDAGRPEVWSSFDVIINATSAAKEAERWAWSLEEGSSKPFCYDLTYNLLQETPFVSWARKVGCKAVDGFGMLVEQAAESFFIWHGVRPDTVPILAMFGRPTKTDRGKMATLE